MAFATETFSDVNPFVLRMSSRRKSRGLAASAAALCVATVAAAWMIATMATTQTMVMSLSPGAGLLGKSSLSPRTIALANPLAPTLRTARRTSTPAMEDTAAATGISQALGDRRTAVLAYTLRQQSAHIDNSLIIAKSGRLIAATGQGAAPTEQIADIATSPAAGMSAARVALPTVVLAEMASRAAAVAQVPSSAPDQTKVTASSATGGSAILPTMPDTASAPKARGPILAEAAPAAGALSLQHPAGHAFSVVALSLPASPPATVPTASVTVPDARTHLAGAVAASAPGAASPSPAVASTEKTPTLAGPAPKQASGPVLVAGIASPSTANRPVPAPHRAAADREEKAPQPAETPIEDPFSLVMTEPAPDDLLASVPLPMSRPRMAAERAAPDAGESPRRTSPPVLAYARTEEDAVENARTYTNPLSLPGVHNRTAIYDISAGTVYLPSGERLEAHSGLGYMIDNPRYVNQKNRGPTPPHTYDLTMRESLFHGVQALRLNPVDGGKIFGRNGLLAHTYMLGRRGDSNGCVSFRDYGRFLAAFKRGEVTRLVVVAHLSSPPARIAWR